VQRMTKRYPTGKAYYKHCLTSKCDKNCSFNPLCEKIAAYEDTGLTPGQIIEMDRLYLEKCKEVNKLKKRKGVKRMPVIPGMPIRFYAWLYKCFGIETTVTAKVAKKMD